MQLINRTVILANFTLPCLGVNLDNLDVKTSRGLSTVQCKYIHPSTPDDSVTGQLCRHSLSELDLDVCCTFKAEYVIPVCNRGGQI